MIISKTSFQGCAAESDRGVPQSDRSVTESDGGVAKTSLHVLLPFLFIYLQDENIHGIKFSHRLVIVNFPEFNISEF